MTDWNNLLNSVNQKVIGIINSTTDSFTGDGVFENKERLGFLLKTAEEKKIKILDVGGVSTKPGFKEVSYEQELKRLNFFISNYFGKFKLSVDTMNYEIARHALENNFEIVNDVSGFNDLKMIQLIIEKAPKIILVHRHPNSSDIQEKMNFYLFSLPFLLMLNLFFFSYLYNQNCNKFVLKIYLNQIQVLFQLNHIFENKEYRKNHFQIFV